MTYVFVVAKVYWRIKYTLAPKFEANVYFSPKLQTWGLMCTLSPNIEAKVNLYIYVTRVKTLARVSIGLG